jgi:hypothetical protein
MSASQPPDTGAAVRRFERFLQQCRDERQLREYDASGGTMTNEHEALATLVETWRLQAKRYLKNDGVSFDRAVGSADAYQACAQEIESLLASAPSAPQPSDQLVTSGDQEESTQANATLITEIRARIASHPACEVFEPCPGVSLENAWTCAICANSKEMHKDRALWQSALEALSSSAPVERPQHIEIEGQIAGELVGKIAEIVGARPVFASDVLAQEELLTAVKELKRAETEVVLMREQVAAYQANEHACEMKMLRGIADAERRLKSAPAETQEERAADPWPHPCRSCGGFGGHESGCPGDKASIPAQIERLSHRIERVAFWLGEALSFISRLDLDTATRLSIKELRDALAEAQPSHEKDGQS